MSAQARTYLRRLRKLLFPSLVRLRKRQAPRGRLVAAPVLAALILATLAVPAASAATLDGVWHDPSGADELYAAEPTERSPRDPMAGEPVIINASTWPIASGQSVWVTWKKNGADQTPVGSQWKYNNGNSSYWAVNLGTFNRGDRIEYTVNADVNGGNAKITGPFSFATTSWSTVTNVASYTDNGTSVDVTTGDSAGSFTPKIRFAFPRLDGFDVQIAPTGNGLALGGISGYTISDTPSQLRISTAELVLAIDKSPYRLSVYKGDGTTLVTRQYDPSVFRNIGWASDGATTVTKIEDHFLTPSDERFEGFGERYDKLNHRGSDVHNYVYNQYKDQGSTQRTYYSVPFFANSAGYGIHVPSTRYSIFNLATHRSDMAGFTVDTGGALDSTLSYQFFSGSQTDVIDDYTSVTGRPQLPPKWAFGLWGSANEWNTQAEVNGWLDQVQSSGIPHSAMVLEQWSDEATFYLWKDATYTPTNGSTPLGYNDLSFPANGAWTDPRQMIQDAHAQGVKVVLWQIPVLKENFSGNPATAPQQHLNDKSFAQAQGFLAKDAAGAPYRIPSGQWFGDSTVPDFTKQAATDWWMSKREYLLQELGVDGFKTDGSEAIFGRDVQFADGRKGDEMHNAYPNEYTEAYSDFVQDGTAGQGALFSRAGTSGGQANSIFWAGDQSSTFGAFQEAVRAGQSAGQSGVPFWAWDLAGFTGDFPSAELYLRSTAQATFSPIMQYHSEKSDPSPSEARTPWNVQARTGDTSVVPVFTKFANVRMNLMPYLYTEAEESATTGVPMMRAMSLSFPDDDQAASYDQQYQFGSQLLVAPLTTQGQTDKAVYLPEGEWYDLWNGGRAIGGVKNYHAGTETIPVFAKAGAVIPLNLNDSYELGGTIGNDVDNYDNLTFRIYPTTQSSYDYFEDSASAHRSISVSADRAAGTVHVQMPALTTTSTLQISGTRPAAVSVGGSALGEQSSVAAFAASASGWYWDSVQQLSYVKLPSSASDRTVLLSGVDKASYEAEFASQTSVGTNTDHAGYTGTGFVDRFETAGDAVEFSVWAEDGGSQELRFRYANGAAAAASRTVTVDGVVVGTLSLPARANWGDWGEAALAVTLPPGRHTVRLSYDAGNTGGINVDHLTLGR